MVDNKRRRVGPKNPNFRNGKTISHGYVVLTSQIWGKNLGRYEHRVVMEAVLGRPLRGNEVIHHRNGDKTDNRPKNLELLQSRAMHNRLHGKGRLLICLNCKADRWYSPGGLKRFKGDIAQYRCRSCAVKARYRKQCRRCDDDFEGGMQARFCRKCTQKNRARRLNFFNQK